MRYRQLIDYLHTKHPTGAKGEMLSKLASWIELDKPRNRQCVNHITTIMGEVQYDVLKINRDVLRSVVRKYGFNIERTVIYLRKYLKWANCNINVRNISLANEEYIGLENVLKTIPFHPNIEKEISGLFNSWTSRYTKDRLKPWTIKKLIYYLQLLNNFIYYIDPKCPMNSLKCISACHTRAFKAFMDAESTNARLTGRRLKKAYINAILCNLKIIFNRAYDSELIVDDPFARIKTFQASYLPRQGACVSEADVNRITYVDIVKYRQMDIVNRYRYIFPRFAVRLSFLAGLRVSELLTLAVEDIRIGEVSDGYIPIYIYGAKQRQKGFPDAIWIKYESIKEMLKLYIETRNELFKYRQIADITIFSEKSLLEGHPLLVNPISLKPFVSRENYRNYFARFMAESGFGHLKNKTHSCRRGLVTHLLNAGWNHSEIMLVSRHKSVSMVQRYDCGNAQDNRKRIKAADTIHEPFYQDKQKALLEESTDFKYFKLIEWLIANNMLPAQDAHNINGLIMQYNHSQLNDDTMALNINNYYDRNDLGGIWGLAKTQTYQRCDYLIKTGILHPCKDTTHDILVPKWEVDNFNLKYIELTKAADSAGYNSKGKLDYLRKQAASKKIASIKVLKLIFLERASWEKWLRAQRKKATAKKVRNDHLNRNPNISKCVVETLTAI